MNASPRNTSLQHYCKLFSEININTSKQRGNAPYKPLLLLSVIDLIAEREITDKKIAISDKLIDRFNEYWKLLELNDFRGGLSLPFYHLKNDGFWKLKFSDRYDGGRPQSIPKLKHDVDYAILDEHLFSLLQDTNYRNQLLDTLLETWFISSNKKISEIVEINHSISKGEEDIQLDIALLDRKKTYLKKSVVRNAFFRKTIVHLYEYHCAFCKIRITSTINQNIVDGAHIKPVSIFYDNSLSNGISLCKNHHWAFDNGLFTIDDDYKIVIAKNSIEKSFQNRSIREFHKEKLLLPVSSEYFPRLDALEWHRLNIFQAE